MKALRLADYEVIMKVGVPYFRGSSYKCEIEKDSFTGQETLCVASLNCTFSVKYPINQLKNTYYIVDPEDY